MSVEMLPVDSTMVSAVGYDPASQTLHVQYHGGRTYQHPGVPPAKWEALQASPSKGKYLNTQVKPVHPHR
jgi:hypothetical protein